MKVNFTRQLSQTGGLQQAAQGNPHLILLTLQLLALCFPLIYPAGTLAPTEEALGVGLPPLGQQIAPKPV